MGVVLANALAQLESDDREVIVLRNIEQLEWSEVGARLGRSPEAARKRWTRALQRLAPLLSNFS